MKRAQDVLTVIFAVALAADRALDGDWIVVAVIVVLATAVWLRIQRVDLEHRVQLALWRAICRDQAVVAAASRRPLASGDLQRVGGSDQNGHQ